MSTEAPKWFSEQMKNKVTHIRQARGARLKGITRRADATEKLKCIGVGRDREDVETLVLIFNREPTDHEMRFVDRIVTAAIDNLLNEEFPEKSEW